MQNVAFEEIKICFLLKFLLTKSKYNFKAHNLNKLTTLLDMTETPWYADPPYMFVMRGAMYDPPAEARNNDEFPIILPIFQHLMKHLKIY